MGVPMIASRPLGTTFHDVGTAATQYVDASAPSAGRGRATQREAPATPGPSHAVVRRASACYSTLTFACIHGWMRHMK